MRLLEKRNGNEGKEQEEKEKKRKTEREGKRKTDHSHQQFLDPSLSLATHATTIGLSLLVRHSYSGRVVKRLCVQLGRT